MSVERHEHRHAGVFEEPMSIPESITLTATGGAQRQIDSLGGSRWES
jgi:hypothetical protein